MKKKASIAALAAVPSAADQGDQPQHLKVVWRPDSLSRAQDPLDFYMDLERLQVIENHESNLKFWS